MKHMKLVFAVSLLIASLGTMPQAFAAGATMKIQIAGSSAMWQTMGLGTYNVHSGTTCLAGSVAPCFHYTNDKFQLVDSRPTFKSGSNATDLGSIWIVWDSHVTTSTSGNTNTPNVWAYIKVDSVVGQRCYFGHPRCKVLPPTGGFPAAGLNEINSSLWGDSSSDTNVPVEVQALFVAGQFVTAAATDIRPEDGLFATCRANSIRDTVNTADPTGLGYNSVNAAGVCPPNSGGTLGQLQGTDIISEFNTSNTAHVLDYNISGTDPFSGQTIPASTVVSAGADPIVFVAKASGPLSGVTNVTDAQLHTVFGGSSCTGPDLGGSAGSIDAWLREPLSGTMNTTEATVFRYPDFSGVSQEQGVDPSVDNPLNQACGAGGTRKRGVGTGDVIKGLKANTNDGVTYAFFSYGNVGTLADNASFRYLQLNGVDPIFHKYVSVASGTALDPGQPNTSVGQIPSAADTPCGNFPCSENAIWSGGFSAVSPFAVNGHGLSFPTLRAGRYKAWSILRLVSDGTALSIAKTIASASQVFAAAVTPDYVPVVSNTSLADPGLLLLRSHYQQKDSAGTNIGNAPYNETTSAVTIGGHTYPAANEAGGDMGGCIMHLVIGTTSTALEETDFTTGCFEN